MKDTELVAALRNLKATFKPIVCLDCQKGDNCTINGCNLIGLAADTIEKYRNALDSVKKLHGVSNGNTRKVLSDALAFFDRYYGPEPELPRIVCDFERCAERDLPVTILKINDCGYNVFAVTQNGCDFTVFYHRPYPID